MNALPRCSACDADTTPGGHASDGPLVRCARCGTRRILTRTRASHAAYGDAYRDGGSANKTARLVALFSRFAPHHGRVLDVGCGDGAFLAALAARGYQSRGIDLDPGAVAAARARGLRVDECAAGSRSLDTAFDVVTLWDLLEHVEDPRALAGWLASHVESGGRIVVVTPDAGSQLDALSRWERTLSRGRSTRLEDLCLNRYHLHRFSRAGLASLFEAAGFTTVAVEPLQLFSLEPGRYLSGFAPGIAGVSGWRALDTQLSRVAFAALTAFEITNKLLFVGERRTA